MSFHVAIGLIERIKRRGAQKSSGCSDNEQSSTRASSNQGHYPNVQAQQPPYAPARIAST